MAVIGYDPLSIIQIQDSGSASIASGANSAPMTVGGTTTIFNNNSQQCYVANGVITFTFATAPVAGTVLELHAQTSMDGTTWTDLDQSIGYLTGVTCRAITTLQTEPLTFILYPVQYKFWLYNATGQTVSAGWTLSILPSKYQAV